MKKSDSNNNDKVSVVIPAYNAESTIADVVEAILSQTKIEYLKEIIVVDDGSTDSTAEIIKHLALQSIVPIKLIRKKNGGVSSARNTGMKCATGEWIALNDSDDIWKPNKLELQMRTLYNNPQIQFLGGAWNSKGVSVFGKKIKVLSAMTIKKMCVVSYPQPSTVIFKRKIFETLGGFDETQKHAEDGNFFLKICSQYNCFYMPEQLVVYGYGKEGFGCSGLSANLKAMYQGNLKNMKEMYLGGYISLPFYIIILFYQYLKYIRRCLICHAKK